MFEMHDIIEGWLLDSTEEKLSPWKSRLLRAHLKGCGRCRGFALELVEFSHDVETVPRKERLKLEDASLLHAQVMAAFHRELESQRASRPSKLRLRTYFGVSPQFAKALGLVLLGLGLLVLLNLPGQKDEQAAPLLAARKQASLALPSPAAPKGTPTVTPFPQLTPVP